MTERTGDTDIARMADETERPEDVLADRPTASKGGRSKKAEVQGEEAVAPEAETIMDLVESVEAPKVVVQPQVMGGLSIRDLEMMPKMDEIRKLEEISVGGATNIEPEVLAAIAGVAAQSVDGVSALGTTSLRRTIRERMGSAERRGRGVDVEVGRREAILDINLRVVYGFSIPKIVMDVRHVVSDRLLNLCGLEAKEINVRVLGIEFPSRMPGRVE